VNTYSFGANMARHRTGLVLGALIGLTGGPSGMLFGAAIGYYLDKLIRSVAGAESWTQAKAQTAFFDATFCVMGKIAKADGQVTAEEIKYAEAVMTRMQLTDAMRKRAIDCFSQGKETAFELAQVLEPLRRALVNNASVKQMFIEIQLQAALVDGEFSPAEGRILAQVCQLLGISQREFEAVAERMKAEQSFHQGGGQGQFEGSGNLGIKQAYGVLGLNHDCDAKSLKMAYRKLMSQHHPDKLVARGLPDEMMQMAKQKTQEIQAAYDAIKKSRK
jgi:DnaJ like chaperone protein|tara:strand:- start:2366 stop:3190 length:825 start_codon:yes stop_codon:yes gene_type:complete